MSRQISNIPRSSVYSHANHMQQPHQQFFPTGASFPYYNTTAQQPYSKARVELELAKGRLMGEKSQSMDKRDSESQSREQETEELKGSLLHTPAPRSKPPQPMEYSRGCLKSEYRGGIKSK